MLENFWHILAIILGFGFLILVHELGHFLVARYFKVRCPYFAVGMGVMGQMPPVVAWRKGIGWRIMKGTDQEWGERCLTHIADQRGVNKEALTIVEMVENPADLAKVPTEHRVKRAELFNAADEVGIGETEYRLMALPLGGYVAMEGQEDMDPTAQSEDPRAFNNQPIYARTAILSAGVVMNVIFGFLFFIIAFGMGVDFPSPTIGRVDVGGPAATAYAEGHQGDAAYQGLQPGDRVLRINGKPTNDFQEITMSVALAAPDTVLSFDVQREGSDQPLTYRIKPEADADLEGLMSVGLAPAPKLEVGSVVQEDASGAITEIYEAGVRPGMVLTAVNATPVADYGDYAKAVAAAGGASDLSVTFQDPTTQATATHAHAPIPTLALTGDDELSLLGMLPLIELTAVVPGSAAEAAGVQRGDLVVQVGGLAWPSDVNAFIETVGNNKKDGLALTVLRGDAIVDLGTLKPQKGKIGVGLGVASETLRVAQPTTGTPAADAELISGALITEVNGVPVVNWAQAQAAFQAAAAQDAESVSVTMLPLGDETPFQVELPLDEASRVALTEASYLPGVPDLGFAMDMLVVKADGPLDSIAIGMSRVKHAGQQVYVTLARLFQGTVGVKNLRGPVGIVDAGRAVAAKGVPWYLYFLGLISINLAVLNFLPLPIVDGGHIVMLGYEKLRGQPAGPRVQQALFLAGLALLGTLFLIVTYHDIARLIFS